MPRAAGSASQPVHAVLDIAYAPPGAGRIDDDNDAELSHFLPESL